MKVIRTIIYEGMYEWLKDQLGRSMPDGKRFLDHTNNGWGSITVMTQTDFAQELIEEEFEEGR